jgi:ATP-binding cassette subfamily B protein
MKKISIFQIMKGLWIHLNEKRRFQLFLLVSLVLLSSLAELCTIGAVFPFLNVISSPIKVYSDPNFHFFIRILNIKSPNDLLIPILLVFCGLTVLSGLIRILLAYCNSKLSFLIGSDLSIKAYENTLFQSYEVHIGRNTSEVINGVLVKVNDVIKATLLPTLNLFSSVIILTVILLTIIYLNSTISFFAVLFLVLIYSIIAFITRKNKIRNSAIIATETTNLIQCLQEGLHGIRDVLLEGAQKVYIHKYRLADARLRDAQASISFLGQSPRYFVEMIAMLLLAGIAYYSIKNGEWIFMFSMLGTLALGAQRMMPLMQQCYSAWHSIFSTYASLNDVLNILNQPTSKPLSKTAKKINFENLLKLKKIVFSYNSGKIILNNLSLEINRGTKIGIVGKSGSGKSTLLDILMGLLFPSAGTIEVDGHSLNRKDISGWQKNIAHVPQQIFLTDSSIAENVAFGKKEEEIDFENIVKVLKIAQLEDFVNSLPEGVHTVVGEFGAKLSGGQRQRIGIARALYKKAKIVILDEATSSLDSQTEEKIMNAINDAYGFETTFIMVAHRISSLKHCDYLIKVNSDGTCEKISYKSYSKRY